MSTNGVSSIGNLSDNERGSLAMISVPSAGDVSVYPLPCWPGDEIGEHAWDRF